MPPPKLDPDEWKEIHNQYLQSIMYSRQEEDAKRKHEYAANQDAVRTKLVELYDKKAVYERQLKELNEAIHQNEKLQEHLVHEYDESNVYITEKRRVEDHTREADLVHLYNHHVALKETRENIASKESSKENALPKNSRHSTRDVPPQTNGAGWTSINGSRRRSRREEEEEPPTDPGNLLSSIYHNPVDEIDSLNGRAMALRNGINRTRPGAGSNGVADEADANSPEGYAAGRAKDRPLKPKQRHSLPSLPSAARSPHEKLPEPQPSGVPKMKSASGRRSLPSAKGSAPPTENSTPAPTEGYEITRDMLIIRDDGNVVTEPPMFADIPLERIDKSHPYWDSEWESLESFIQPQLDKWKEKLVELRGSTEAARHKIFLANRQVNRGQAVIDFLRDEDWHPYQFVGKVMMNKFYKTFINYDTMFRLVNVHEELKKFDLDVTPLEWLRQRMYDIATAQGDKFSLSKVTHDLYHDSNLKFLREKHGFGNIGRPSGYKLRDKDPEQAAERAAEKAAAKAAKKEAGSVRRKNRRSIGQVDPDDFPALDVRQKGAEQLPQEYLEPVTPRLQKRQRIESAAPTPPMEEPEDDLEYDGWTSTDSFSAGRIMHLDWRVYQIKTRALTTSTEVTQYWTWKQERNLFEHQVLRDVQPKVTWGFYQKPINFDLSLEEIKEIRYASDSQKIVVVINNDERGDVLTYFKRERTKKRFLSFTKKKGIKLVKSTRVLLEDQWNTMKSEQLPNEDSDM